MKLSKTRWVGDLSLVTLGVCLVLPVYIINRQYAQAQTALGNALLPAPPETRNNPENPEKYNGGSPDKTKKPPSLETHDRRDEETVGTLPDATRNLPSPEIYYRRKEAVGNWMLWLFLLPLLGGLTARRWVASTLIVILWLLTWHLQGLRY
jgi:hypothetical protein